MKLDILLVEDNPAQTYLVGRALRLWKSPYVLHVVTTVAAAIAFLNCTGVHDKAPRPHIALVDLSLPDGRGFSVIREIKENPNFRSIAVIVMSTSAREADIQEAVQLHANAYIQKPVESAAIGQLFGALESFWRLDARFALKDPG